MRSTTLVLLCSLVLACGGGRPREITPLAAAARAGDLQAIDDLLARGADIDEGSGVNGWPPVMHAIHKGQTAALERLLERGARLDGNVGGRALLFAAGYGDADMVRVLLAHGVRPFGDALFAAAGGFFDIDYGWNGCSRHTAVARELLLADPRLRIHGAASMAVRALLRWHECRELLALIQ